MRLSYRSVLDQVPEPQDKMGSKDPFVVRDVFLITLKPTHILTLGRRGDPDVRTTGYEPTTAVSIRSSIRDKWSHGDSAWRNGQ